MKGNRATPSRELVRSQTKAIERSISRREPLCGEDIIRQNQVPLIGLTRRTPRQLDIACNLNEKSAFKRILCFDKRQCLI